MPSTVDETSESVVHRGAKSLLDTLLALLAPPHARIFQQITARTPSARKLLVEVLAPFVAITNYVLRPSEPPCSVNRTRPSQSPVLVAHEAEDSQ
jgi:hypothetical protein